MFNKGRPKKHVNISFLTYETGDGTILSYEMNSKGLLKNIGNQNNIVLKSPSSNETNVQQLQNVQQNIPQNITENQNVQIQNFSNVNQVDEQNETNMFSNDFNFDNNPLDDFLYNYDDISKQHFGGFSDLNGSFLDINLNDDFYFNF